MYRHVEHPSLVPFNGKFTVRDADTRPAGDTLDKAHYRELLEEKRSELDRLQRLFYAHDRHALLLIFQGLDASGKDSTVRAVMRSVDPSGCYVHAFKQPSQEELQHDFLWRTTLRLPGRGMIGIFNRSYYEEVLITRVHPGLLDAQRLPVAKPCDKLWDERYQSICHHELHLARNGTVVMKFWLNISREEQRKRFLKRLNRPDKHWKFSEDDIREREYWDGYLQAYEAMLNATSRDYAPWYAIPADNKPFARLLVATLLVDRLKQLELNYPQPDEDLHARFESLKDLLKD